MLREKGRMQNSRDVGYDPVTARIEPNPLGVNIKRPSLVILQSPT